ncbi:MAG: class I SAM-dependent methyltransferase [Candidatus Lokiarchaeota archaeon]|nr:class I SAM-dependent methyltransferase [Candidatus Lokiarchaeota archaeon]
MNKETIQEDQYSFPYHYLIETKNDRLSFKKFIYGFEYFTYLTLIKNRIIKLKPESIIDIGSGDGKLIYELCKNQQFYTSINRIIGIDKVKKAISFANAFNESEKVRFFSEDILNFKSKSFDVGILMEVIEHFSDKDLNKLIEKISELISIDGFLFVSVPSKNQKLQSKHFRHYDKNDLIELFKNKFKVENFFFLCHETFINKLIKMVYLISDQLHFNSFKKKLFSLLKSNYFYTDESKCLHIVAIFRRIKEK